MNEIVTFLEEFCCGEKPSVKEETIAQLKAQMRKQVFYAPNLPRILLIGKFNSGKSTLVNALVGKKVAATDCFEKTAWISRFWPVEEEFCELTLIDKTKRILSLEEFLCNTENNCYTKEQLASIDRVDIGCTGTRFNYALIDTPGFGSVNEDNEKKALDALKDADVVLYLVNVTKLGNLREAAIINEIKSSGVPMICVGSFYDGDIAEDMEYDEVVDMIARNTGFEKQKIFAVSAREFLGGNLDEEESGIGRLRRYFENIAINNLIYRQNAAAARNFRILNQFAYELNSVHGQLLQMKQMQDSFLQEYDYIHARIRNKLADFIRVYVKDTLYGEYKETIINTIRQLQIANSATINSQAILEGLIPSDYMERYWEQLSDVVFNKMMELWKEHLGQMDSYQDQMKKMFDDNAFLGSLDLGQLDVIMNAGYSETLAKQGVKMSFSMAGLASVYEAWLGANAATVALGGALVSTGLPILMMGMGLTWFALKNKQNEKIADADVSTVLEHNIDSFSEKVIEHAITKLEAVDYQVKQIYMQQMQGKIGKLIPGSQSVDQRIGVCENYIQRITDQLDQLSYIDAEGNDRIKEINRLSQQAEKLEGIIAKLEGENQEYQNQIVHLTGEIDQLNCEIGDATSKIKKLEDKLCGLNQQAKDLESQAQKKEQEFRKLKNTNRNLKTEKEKLEKEKLDLSRECMTVQKKLSDAEEQYGKESAEAKRLRKALSDNKNKLGQTQKAMSDATNQYMQTQRVLMQKTTELNELKQEHTNVIRDKEKIQKKNQELDAECKEKQCIVEKLTETNRKLSNGHHENNTEITKLCSEMRRLEKENEKLREETFQDGDAFSHKMQMILNLLDPVINDSRNKFRLSQLSGLDAKPFAPLVFLSEELLAEFVDNLRGLLLEGTGFLNKHTKEITELIDKNYIYTNKKKFKIYFHVYPVINEISFQYIDTFLEMGQHEELRRLFRYDYALENDQIRYKMIDQILLAQKEILMVCPWVGEAAWAENNGQYQMSMKMAVKKALDSHPKLQLMIVTGYEAKTKKSGDAGAENSDPFGSKRMQTNAVLDMLEQDFAKYKERMHIFRDKGLHIKLLTIDNVCAFKGSLNFLSNQSVYKSNERFVRTKESMDLKLQLENVESTRKEGYRCADKELDYRPL